ncbi:hypothetical protein OAW57_00145, partial [Flavobacteriales bacterium]|nr:hypothetical protein [Flavobacteriales bacterium]
MRIILSALLLILAQSASAESVIVGCTIPTACNYDPDATQSDPSLCDFESCLVYGCTVSVACNFNPEATVNDGTCDFVSCQGCTDECACNFDEEATIDNGLCDYECDFEGCTIPEACNYCGNAVINDGSCDFFSCLVFGCNNPSACNYDPEATFNDGSCDFVSCIPAGCTIEEACNYDPEAELNDGTCEFSSCAGCTDECAPNYDATATIDNGSCDAVLGCTNAEACNFDPCADTNDGSCDFLSCQIIGCMDVTACNYDGLATLQTEDVVCEYPETHYDCDGNCLMDTDGDGVCDQLEVLGCTNPNAINFDVAATEDNGSCEVLVEGCTDMGACNFSPGATTDDGSCEYISCAGCLVASACNFDPMALIANNELCLYPEQYYDCDGNCLMDGDGDGVCDQLEIEGCQDEAACNYNFDATDAGFCSYPIANFDCDGNSLRPIFTAFPANADVDACNVPSADEAVVEAMYSQYAPGFEATYNNNECYASDMDVVIAFVGEVRLDGDCENNYVLVRSWSATDCAGYTRTREQILNVSDTTAPALVDMPADQTISCDMVDGADFGMASATDDCGEASVSLDTDIVDGECEGQYTIVRTFTATDLCGNETLASQTIQVIDETAPVMEELADLVLDCTDSLSDELPAATDNCSDVVVSVSDEVIAGDCPQEYTVVRTFTALDECGNASTMVQNVTFVDYQAPVVVSGYSADIIYVNNLNGETAPVADLAIEDNCDADATWSSSDEVLAESAAAQTILRTYTISDACGNELVLEETIEVTLVNPGCTDNAACNYDDDANIDDESCEFCSCGQNACGCTNPEACNYDDANEYEDGSCEYAEEWYDCDGNCLDSNGNAVCDIEELGCMDPTACNYDASAFVEDGSCDYCSCEYTDIDGFEANTSSVDGYNVVVELAQTHLEGVLEGMHTYRVYIETSSYEDVVSAVSGDEEFALEINTTTSFYQSPFGAAAGGNISPAMVVVAPDAEWDSYVTIGATTSADNAGGLVSTIGTDPWENEFEAGNSFSIQDNIGGGWFMAPPSQDNAIAGDDNRVLVAQLTTDGVISGQFTAQIFPGGHSPNGDIRPEFTFMQRPVGAFACPTIDVAPEDETVSCDTEIYLPAGEDFAVSYDFSAADAIGCEGPLNVVDVIDLVEAGNCTGNYTVTRTMEIENCAGQSAFHTYVITVQDITAPVFTSFPADYTVECSDDMPMEGAEASDNCGPVTIDLVTDTAFTEALGNYTITRTFTATDDCGNATTQVQTITVQDTTAPELVIPADYTVECSDEMPMEDAVIADNCGDMVLVLDQDTILTDALGNYTITRTFTVTDDAGNSTTATQTIAVQDTTNPEFTYVPADVTIECSDADLDAVLTEASMASDNCGEFAIVEATVVDETDAVGNYTVTRTFTVTDDAGNSSVAVQVIVVQDTTAPVLTIPADYTTECSEEIVYDEASATDNCGPVVVEEVSRVRVDGDCVGSYQMVRTFTATDDAGNATTLVQTITVEDTTAPELTIPESYTVECSDELVLEDALAVDNCSSCATEFDFSSSAEGYGMSLELVAEHLDGELAGMETYRVYLDLAAASDVVTSFSGSEEFALELNTTTSFYQHPLGAATPAMLSDMALDAVPALAYDSYITLGVDGPAGAGEQNATFIPAIPGGPVGTWPEEFEAGNNLVINSALGSGWYVTPDASNGVAGDDQRILIAQLTTNGDLSGQFRTQIFPEGDQENDVRADMSFEHERDCSDLPIVLVEEVTNFTDDWNYTLERTFTATDDCGNSTTATQIIVVEDTTAPELWTPADYTVECSDDIPQVAAEYYDNCSEVDFTETVEIIDVECAGTYKIRRSFLAVDQSGNSSSAVQVITVQDTTAPVLTLPEDYTVECSDEMPMEDAYAYDNCQVCDDAFDHTSTVEGVGLSLEFVQAHHEGELAGMETYRVYLEASEGDVLTSLSGNDEFALELNTTTSFYQHALGGATPSDINGAMLDMVPELAFDSYVTVGLTQAPGMGEEAADLMPGSWESAFEAGSSISVNDGLGSGWYTLPFASNGTIDESGRILVAQLTTDGDISGQFRAQLFPGGDQVNDVRADLSFEHARTCSDLTIDLVTEIVPGNAAGNYTIERTFTATDDCGNETVGTQVITVEDTTAPEFTVVPEDYTVECSDDMPMDDAFAVDACQVCEDAFDVESNVDGVGLSLELVQAHAYGELAGMETYRVYLDVAEGDVLTSLSGNDEFALELNTTTSFYQHTLGGATPSDINGAMLDMVPELAFDSYVSVGLTQAPGMGEEAADLMPGSWEDAFEAGSSISVNDGLGSGWYTLPYADNGTAGASGRILVAQLTTDGDISGQFRAQIFPGGDQVNDVRADLSFVHARTCSDLTIDVETVITPGNATGNYTITRTFTATDDAYNSSQAVQVITVEDTT